MAPDVLSTFIFVIICILSIPMYLSRHVIIKTLIFHLLPCYHRLLLLLLSSRCSSRFIHYFNTESIVFWSLFISSCGYLLLSHILILLCVILIVYQVYHHSYSIWWFLYLSWSQVFCFFFTERIIKKEL
jgi:hypothetical protein